MAVDLSALALAAALGEEIEPKRLQPRPRIGGACVRFLRPSLEEPYHVDGVAQAERIDGVAWVLTYRASGRAGAVLATGPSAAEARARAARAAECIRFRPVDAQAVA
jgi:hypothetical protein